MKWSLAIILSTAILFPTLLFSAAEAQPTSPSSSGSTITVDLTQMSFLELREKRNEAEAQLRRDMEEKDALSASLNWLQQEESARQELEIEKNATRPDQAKIRQLTVNASLYHNNAATSLTAEQLRGAIKSKQAEIDADEHSKDLVERKMSELIDIEKPKQEFNTKISLIFAGLVAVVIAGFFVISWLDENVRKNIFSGQAGIQFLTLFSLVIAIILFGITGILEGKELSALLGGLSGYILGRSFPGDNNKPS